MKEKYSVCNLLELYFLLKGEEVGPINRDKPYHLLLQCKKQARKGNAHVYVYRGCVLPKINRFLHESLLKIWDFFHECEKT